ATPTTEIYTLSLHDALPISYARRWPGESAATDGSAAPWRRRQPGTPAAPGVAPHSAGSHPAPVARHGRETSSGAPYTCRRRCTRSEEHTSELQSRENLVCRL